MKKTLKALLSLFICLLLLVSAVTPAFAALGKVKSLTLSAVTPTSATLKWKKVSGAKGYEIQRYQASKWKNVATTKSTSYTVKDLKLGTTYKFRVRAYSSVNGNFSDVLTVTTGPATVKGLKATTKTATQFKLVWNKVSGATGYRIQQYKNNKWVTVVKSTQNRTATVKNIVPGKANKFRIAAYKKYNGKNYWGVYSPAVSIKAPQLAKPTALKIATATESSITLSWNKVAGATSYYVYKVNGDTQSRVATVTSNSCKIANLTPSTDYTFSVRTFLRTADKDYLSQFSDKLSVRTAPGKVTTFNAPSIAENKITLSWKPVKGANGYEIWQYNSTTDGWEYYGFSTKTSFTAVNLISTATYKFKVRAYHTINGYSLCGPFSDEQSVSTAKGTVSNLTFVQATSSSIQLSWNRVDSATSYELVIGNSGKEVKTVVLGQRENVSAIIATVLDLNPNTRYDVSVCAVFPNSSKSEAATKTVTTAPNKVGGLRAVAESNGIRLEWAASDGASMYEISQYSAVTSNFVVIDTTASTTYFVSGLAQNTTHSFKVRPCHTDSEKVSYGQDSDIVSATISGTPVTPPTPQKPSAPASVSARNTSSGTSYSIAVSWSAVSGAAGYEVSFNNGVWAILGSTASPSYTATGLKASTNYSFRVRAYVMSGSQKLYSDYSAVATAKTSAAPVTPPTQQKPSAPTNVSATNTSNGTSYSIAVSWSAVSGAAGYEVSILDGSWKAFNTTSSTSYTATGLNASTSYSFKVRAYVMSGSQTLYSDYSATATAKTSAAPVTPPVTPSSNVKPSIPVDLEPTLTPSTSKAISGFSVSLNKNGREYSISWNEIENSVYHVEFFDPSQSKWVSAASNKWKSYISVLLEEDNLNAKYESASDNVSKISWSAISSSTNYEVRNEIAPNTGVWTNPISSTTPSASLRLSPDSNQSVRVTAIGNVKFRVFALDVSNEAKQLAYSEYNAKIYTNYDDITFKTPTVGSLTSSSSDSLKEAYALMLVQAMNNTRYEKGKVTIIEKSDMSYTVDANNIKSIPPLPKSTLEDLAKDLSETQKREMTCTYNNGYGSATTTTVLNNEAPKTKTSSAYLFRVFAPDDGNYLYDQHNLNSFKSAVKSVSATPGSNGSYTVKIVLNKETATATTKLKYHSGLCATIADNTESLAEFGSNASATVGDTTITAKINKNYTIDTLEINSPFSVKFTASAMLVTVSGTLPGNSITNYTITR